MILDVKFNTKEKALKCLNILGKRAIDIWSFEHNGETIGFWVHYWQN